MGCTDYLLSKAVKQELKTEGIKIEDKERTDDLREKARYFVRLLTEENQATKSQLLNRLMNLKVWGVRAIKLTQKVYGVTVTKDSSHIVFDDKDESNVEIYILIKDSRDLKVDFELSKELIRYCGITDHIYQKLVLPIIQYPQEEIEKLLEEYGLDEPTYNECSFELLKTVSEGTNEEESSTIQTGNGTMLSPKTPSSHRDPLDRESRPEVPQSSSVLRDRIPALDQSIASVQEAAALPSTVPRLIVTPSRIHNTSPSFGTRTRDMENVQHSEIRSEVFSAVNITDEAKGPPLIPTEERNEPRQDAFEFANFHSEFSEVFRLDTPSQTIRTSSIQHHSISRYRRSPRATEMEPSPEGTMYGLQKQKVGLLGEIFIKGWLSNNLKDEWDPTRHWTSRNRNILNLGHPFTGKEKDYSDFTYPDTSGKLTELLTPFFLHNVSTWFRNPPTYHLEVKTTSEAYNEPFYMSNNQVNKAREYTITWDDSAVPENVYVVIRVYDLDKETTPGFTVYVDPWAMYLAGELDFLASETYLVTPNAVTRQFS